MKIKFVSPSPKAGTVEHVAAGMAHSLIAAGFAELCPLPRRGEPGWLEERIQQSPRAGAPDAHDVDPNSMQKTVDRAFTNDPPTFPFANLPAPKGFNG